MIYLHLDSEFLQCGGRTYDGTCKWIVIECDRTRAATRCGHCGEAGAGPEIEHDITLAHDRRDARGSGNSAGPEDGCVGIAVEANGFLEDDVGIRRFEHGDVYTGRDVEIDAAYAPAGDDVGSNGLWCGHVILVQIHVAGSSALTST